MKTLTRQQVLGQISEFFHADYHKVETTRFHAGEPILFAANCGTEIGFGFCVVTGDRIFHVYYYHDEGVFGPHRERITLSRQSDNWDVFEKMWNIGYSGHETWTYGPPTSPLTSKESKSQSVKETSLARVVEISRHDYTINWHGRETTFVSITPNTPQRYDSWLVLYSLQEGQALYELLDGLVRQPAGSPQQGDTAGKAEIMASIRELAQLRDSGAITPHEFETKKRELLARL